MITIYDIAKATGYSAPTVSKALNGLGTLSVKTRERIIKTAKDMGYTPNISARTLSTKKSNLIGVIYDDTGMHKGFAHPLFSVILDRFREQVERAGYDIIFLSRHFNMTYFLHSQYRNVDGVIIINPATQDRSEFSEFVTEKIPCVSTNCIIDGITTIISDNEKCGYIATEHFIKKGHRKIAFLSAPKGISSAPTERYIGFRKALEDYNIPFDEELFVQSEQWVMKGGSDAFEQLYKRRQDFTAIFAVTDWLARGIYDYAEAHGLKIPEDISVIGFDNTEASGYMAPPLTTFQQDAIKIADLAADILLRQINGEETPQLIRCDATLLDRKSVKDMN